MQNNLIRHVAVFFVLSVLLLPAAMYAEVVKWDYVRQPVGITENKPSVSSALGLCVESAFDGYGAQGDTPATVRAWQQTVLPTLDSPVAVEIDYGKPVSVGCFVHYFYVPGSRDLRYTAPIPSAYKTVRISLKNDNDDWSEVVTLKDLPVSCPQKLITGSSRSARYWRIEVLELADGAEILCSYEIETYLGGIPEIKPWKESFPDLPAEFHRRISNHKPAAKDICTPKTFQDSDHQFRLSFQKNKQIISGALEIQMDGQSCTFQNVRKNIWQSVVPSGDIFLEVKHTKMGFLLNLSFQSNADCPNSYKRGSVQLSAPAVDLYYIPAYVWSTNKPADLMVNSCNVQTRMAGLGVKGTMLLLFPGTDRGSLGFTNGCVKNDLLLGREPTPILITAIQGDWWRAFQFAVKDIYDFKEVPQTLPVSEIQYGISRYLLRDDIWEPTLGTLKSWPVKDPHTDLCGGFVCFGFYGATYSIPAYWARYVMNGDKKALERCQSIAQWLCRSGVRVQDGPMQGGFFSSQDFYDHAPITMDAQGRSQAMKPVLTSQSTGAALWTLLYYRKVTGDMDPNITQAINEAASWLIKTQNSDGGWPYAHNPDGTEYGLKKKNPPAPSSGSIWNIWALWKLGKETNNSKFMEAAARAPTWFHKTFVIPHHYHGYWEDVGPGSREGYEAGIAAVAFGEMGDKELAVEAAKDAMQWVFTRQIECREESCSAGLVAEQTGWPPASYCNPMMGLAAYTAWQITQDDFWKPFARIPKAIGWWYQPETGAMVRIVDSTQMAPIVGPCFESWWSDWCIAQVGTLTLRWLVREANVRSGGDIAIDEELLSGKAIHQNVKLWTPPGGLHPILPPDGQVNWLGFRGEDSILIAFMNNGNKGEISCPLDSRDVQGASLCPKNLTRYKNKKSKAREWDGLFPVRIEAEEMIVLEWRIRP